MKLELHVFYDCLRRSTPALRALQELTDCTAAIQLHSTDLSPTDRNIFVHSCHVSLVDPLGKQLVAVTQHRDDCQAAAGVISLRTRRRHMGRSYIEGSVSHVSYKTFFIAALFRDIQSIA